MAVLALHSGATGLTAMEQAIDVIAHNIANTNTTGFKSLSANFEDLLYQEKEQPGAENASGDKRPAGLFLGLGTRLSNTQLNVSQGSAIPDTGPMSMLIDGQGMFQVTVDDRTVFTRAGNFARNSEGDMVLGNSFGPRLEPPINIPEGTTSITILPDGTVNVTIDNDPEQQEVGRLELANFTNPTGLRPLGGTLYDQTDASGPPIIGNPAENAFGVIRQGFLEASNVDPVSELVKLIKTQRYFEFNSQTVQAADEALQVIGNLRRF